MIRNFLSVTTVALILMLGCSSQPATNPSLAKAKAIYISITQEQEIPEEPQFRQDWPALPVLLAESAYQYPVPYFPYFLHNVAIVYPKEAALLLSSPLRGTLMQDEIDNKVAGAYLSYEQLFLGLWREKQANFINMDEDFQHHHY